MINCLKHSKDILNKVRNLQSVVIDDVVYDIEYFFCADMKFLAICMGIESASSTFSCVWCNVLQQISITLTKYGQ